MRTKTSRRSTASKFTLVAGQEYKVLSLHPEWAWAIMFGRKDIEYRSWATPYRGTLLIHASSRRNPREWLEEARESICDQSGLSRADLPDEFPASSILGAVELVDCVEVADTDVHWVLRNAQPLAHPISNIMGKLQIWRWTPSAQQAGAAEGGTASSRSGITSAVSKPPKQARPDRKPAQRMLRRIDDVPAEEIIRCLRACATARPANEVDLLRAASRQLGFARVGARVEQVLKAHVTRAVRQGTLLRDEKGLRTGTR